MTHIEAHMDDWFDALDAIEGPGRETIEAWETIMEAAFAATQARVHVITGSLKASGAVSFRLNPQSWVGEISYGGPAPGMVHDPVDYAGEEFGKGREHDALDNVHLISSEFEDAMYLSMKIHMGI